MLECHLVSGLIFICPILRIDNFRSFPSPFLKRRVAWYEFCMKHGKKRVGNCLKLIADVTNNLLHCHISHVVSIIVYYVSKYYGIEMEFLIPGLSLVRTHDSSKRSFVTILTTVAYFRRPPKYWRTIKNMDIASICCVRAFT